MDVVDPGRLLSARLAHAPAAPAVTYYDAASAERVELSATSLDNWVAKTAGLLADALEVPPGGRVAVALPLHWQTLAILLGVWTAGAVAVVLDPAEVVPSGCAAAFLDSEHARLRPLAAPSVARVSLRGPGLDPEFDDPVITDYATEVSGQPDRFARPNAAAETAALELAGRRLAGSALVAESTRSARAAGLTGADRVLSTLPPSTAAGLITGLLAGLAAGASLVLVARASEASPGQLERWARVERVSASVGVDLPGLRRVGERSLDPPA